MKWSSLLYYIKISNFCKNDEISNCKIFFDRKCLGFTQLFKHILFSLIFKQSEEDIYSHQEVKEISSILSMFNDDYNGI